MSDGFFTERDGRFLPTPAASGFWAPNSLNGPATSGLLAFALDRDARPEGFIVTRFAVDMFRTVATGVISTDVRIVHAGRRTTLAEVDLSVDGIACARATAQFAQPSSAPAEALWQAPGWSAPAPENLPEHIATGLWTMVPIPAHHASITRAQDGNPPPGKPTMGALTPIHARQAWLRADRPVVSGAPLTGFQSLAVLADFCNPLANAGQVEIAYINPDLTVHLHREVQGEWIGVELARHHSHDGLAIGSCLLHDVAGPLGVATVSAIAHSRRPRSLSESEAAKTS